MDIWEKCKKLEVNGESYRKGAAGVTEMTPPPKKRGGKGERTLDEEQEDLSPSLSSSFN